MQTQTDVGARVLHVTRHPLRAGERERQAGILERNANLMVRFGADRRAAYSAMASMTEMAEDVECSEVSEPEATGWRVRPRSAAGDRAILFIHGGGYHLGDAVSYRGMASQIAARTHCTVFAIDYPLAPEHAFPAAFEAARAARDWLIRAPCEQLAIVGDSAGGGLALALLNQPLTRGRVSSVVAFSPWTDLALTGPSFNDPEAHDPIFKPAILANLATSYLAGADPRDWRASPLWGIPDEPPPIAIQVGSEELLLDDSLRYANFVAGRGTIVTLDIFDGMHHVFQRDAGSLDTARAALDLAGKFIMAHWC